jgi:hypothetical protein
MRFRILEKLRWGFVFWENYLSLLLFGANDIWFGDTFMWQNHIYSGANGKCHVKNRKYSSLDLEIDPSWAQKRFLFDSFS